jgi:WD40 repeat protein
VPGDNRTATTVSGPDWVAPAARRGSSIALYAVATSSDDRYLAAGGGDKIVHVWDLRSNQYLKVCAAISLSRFLRRESTRNKKFSFEYRILVKHWMFPQLIVGCMISFMWVSAHGTQVLMSMCSATGAGGS